MVEEKNKAKEEAQEEKEPEAKKAEKPEPKTKVKKKRWYQIHAPKMFNEFAVGETLAVDPNTLIGKKLKVNLMNITRNAKNQNIDVTLKITKVAEGMAKTELYGYEMLPASIKRMVRRGRNRIDQSFLVETSDNKKLGIKTFMLTRANTTKRRLSGLAKKSNELLTKAAKAKRYDVFIMDVMSYKIQKEMREGLRKIYPLRNFEIRGIKLVSQAEENAKANNR